MILHQNLLEQLNGNNQPCISYPNGIHIMTQKDSVTRRSEALRADLPRRIQVKRKKLDNNIDKGKENTLKTHYAR